jgi:Tol biopolymer transport system component
LTVRAPPLPSDPVTREDVEALIEEARQRARRRRHRNAAAAVIVCLGVVVLVTLVGRATQSESASTALAAQSSAVAEAAPSQIAFITGARTYCQNPSCTGGPPQSSDAFNGKLYAVNPDGSGLRLLADRASITTPPAWSPDGQKLAFNRQARRPGLNGGIYVVNVDGSGLRSLTSGGGPAWSPDGQKIAFVRVVNAPTQWYTPNGPGPNWDILVMNADGSGTENLTRSPKPDDAPAWSPDGQKFAFRRTAAPRCGTKGCGPGEKDIFVMNADGSGQQNLTREPTRELGSPSWSPDGQKILFQRRAKGKNWEIFVANADGSGLRNVTHNPSHDIDADWSPDGQRIVFRTSRHGRWELHIMNADGSGQLRLTRTPAANESRPSWSADGPKIAFTREVGGNFELYVVNADGSGQRRLTPNSPVVRWVAYAWSPGS